jgi:formylglycine-generating enzyme required for sulfatase activity
MPDRLYRNPVDGYEMVLVPAGTAIFGSREGEPDSQYDGKPQFEAQLPDYYMGLYCVTNAQYAAFLSAAKPSGNDLQSWILLDSDCHVRSRGSDYGVDDEQRYGDHPVVQVSRYGAEAYCAWSGLRLPSELEWEKAARGSEGLVYPWGNEWDATKCRHAGNQTNERTCRVWEYPEGVSVWGLYNMTGNVSEWCADWYEADAYHRYARGEFTPPRVGSGDNVVRGGSWAYVFPRAFRAAFRVSNNPSNRGNGVGFRCARGL